MKNLFSVLLITIFAVASSVAIQEVPQTRVDASTLVSSSAETIVEEALWHKKHHQHKKCRNKIMVLPFPKCENECKAKCEVGGQECDEECKLIEHDCREKCRPQTGECKGNCEHHKGECKNKCKDAKGPCNLGCDATAVDTCTDIAGMDPAVAVICPQIYSCNARCTVEFIEVDGKEEICGNICSSSNCLETCTQSKGLPPRTY
ncbi:hypothetical protein EDD21DRAFT_351887 [Dissophora ornata]|nr:hypothetical protein BGZ58_001344 [Dissophora ornata]KAI8603420.1 hypothetical protein EDD21DRAFT_351887 [Dissophora ornata]